MDTDNLILLSLERGAAGICAHCSRLAKDGAITLEAQPLTSLPLCLYPLKKQLQTDWEALATQSLSDAWPALWRVFWETQPGNTHNTAALPIQRVSPPQPRATAAHPRAFRGTKYQPPKPSQARLALTEWLAEDRLFDQFLAQLDYTQHTVPLRDGRQFNANAQTEFTTSKLLAASLESTTSTLPDLPDVFRKHFLWSLRQHGMTELIAWLSLWQQFNHPKEGPLLAELASLCALNPTAHRWASLALNVSPERRGSILANIRQHKIYNFDNEAKLANQIANLSAETENDQRFAFYIKAIFLNLKAGVSADYSLQGCQLANHPYLAHQAEPRLLIDENAADVPMQAILHIAAVTGQDNFYLILECWRLCAKLPGFSAVLERTEWEKLSVTAATRWLDYFLKLEWEENRQLVQARWKEVRKVVFDWHASVIDLPHPWQEKHINLLLSTLYGHEYPEKISRSSNILLPLLRRMCAEPYSPDYHCGNVLGNLADLLDTTAWQTMRDAEDAIWLGVEQACRRDNDDGLVARGIYALCQIFPALTLQSLTQAGSHLLRTAHLLGCLGYDHRLQVLREIRSNSAWFARNWQSDSAIEVCQNLYKLCQESKIDSPLPRQFRLYLEGQIQLREGQIARHCGISLQRLIPTQLQAIEAEVWQRIDARFQLRHHSSQANHAVRFYTSIGAHRRAFKRFIQHYIQHGDRFAYLRHPLNLAWFSKHSKLDVNLWGQTGIQRQYGNIHLALETDPFEILMLGTYTGSCLGLGGLCDDSAISCLLDGNKQVIYARDQHGRVVARQLLAIDESDRLVCFSIYPLNTPETIQDAFFEYDQGLSDKLQLPIFYGSQDAYWIEPIVTNNWWDDGNWERTQIDCADQPVT